ncbi:probable disease resistance protein At5g63020 [Gossypium arboreum]|uniref:probable disease resistance protein At5g63020 n=1 Tax=Gossypium arboreum TaxID=29729 RepID=UPI0008194D75|nr:probable disease resistance protein At5g63020 [Gossypium arboreum]
MDFVSPIFDIVPRLWGFGAKRLAHVTHLGRRLEELRTALNDLSDHRDDVKERVEMGVRSQQEMVKKQVERWLSKVEIIELQVIALIHEGNLQDERKCFGCCPRNLQKAYKIGKKVLKKKEEVEELLKKGDFAAVTQRLPAPPASQMVAQFPMENTVGLDSKVEPVWKKIEDGNVGIIGLYGIGGVGKTTLLKKINNEFSIRNHEFDSVIWVTQSKATKSEEFQEIVRRKLEISDDIWQKCSNENDRACEIFRLLSGTRFVLLLDDVQKSFFKSQLTSLGIPLPNKENGSKIIFTTRSEELCGYLGAEERIKVECLPPEQALSLFSMTVGEYILNSHPEIPKLAEIIAARCRGLPLALLTVGTVMASRKSHYDWICAIEMLQNYPSEFSGMGEQVFPPIKFSYDSLTSPIARKCFLYCSIFPENCTISVDELIDLWIGEGLLDEISPRKQGEFIIFTLKLSCLLEGDESMEFVWMHEMIRDMALWLARDEEKNKNKILVARRGRLTDQEFNKWIDSSWVSLWGCSDREVIHYPPTCPNLSTLLIRDTLVNAFPGGFFEFMTGLKALDLSGNQGLVELPPEIGRLRILQYLNLSLTSITKLPTGLANLRNLRCLLLDYTMHLKEIPPREVMSCLSLLQVYSKMNGVMEYFDEVKVPVDDELAFLEVLEGFSHMNKICITIFCHPSVEKIFSSYTKRAFIRKLKLIDCTGLTSLCPINALPNLGKLEIFRCCSLQEIRFPDRGDFHNLRQVHVGVCPLLRNLDCLAYAINLEILTILDCQSMKQVISEETVRDYVFLELKTLSLTCLPSLETICPLPKAFSSPIEIEVSRCPCLRRLPFDDESVDFLKKIRGELKWWEALDWDSDSVKEACSFKFKSTSAPSGKAKEMTASTSKEKTAIAYKG